VDVVFEHDGKQWYIFLMDDFLEIEGSKPLSFILELRRRVLRVACDLILERQEGFLLKGEISMFTSSLPMSMVKSTSLGFERRRSKAEYMRLLLFSLSK